MRDTVATIQSRTADPFQNSQKELYAAALGEDWEMTEPGIYRHKADQPAEVTALRRPKGARPT